MSRLFCLAAFLLATALAISCASSRHSADWGATPVLTLATGKAMVRLSNSDTDFGLAVFRRLMRDARHVENPIVSPWGLGRAMDILYNGAAGETSTDMGRVLHLSELANDLKIIDDANLWLNRNLVSARGGVSVENADALWYADRLRLNPDFADRIVKSFDVRLQSVDFARRDAAAQIVSWVRTNSPDHGQAYVAPINPGTNALLVDVLRMDGLWNDHFDPALTRPHAFTTATGRHITVPMMMRTASYPYAERNGFRVVSIPYQGWRMSMDIFLPDASSSGMRSVESVLGALPLARFAHLPEVRGTVGLPRFDVRYSANLSEPIAQLGLGRIFDPTGADFSLMWADGNAPVDRVLQQSYVSVNEWGTKAGTTTSVVMQALIRPRLPFTFIVDRPFVFLIRDRVTGTVLFAGLVNKP